MQIKRRFSTAGKPVADQIDWRTTAVRVTDANTGAVIFQMDNVEVPAQWSENAAQIIANKYFRKAGVPAETITINSSDIPDAPTWNIDVEAGTPNWLWPRVALKGTTFGAEHSAKQVFHRLAGCWAYWGWHEGLFDKDNAQIFYDECYMMLAKQIAAPNSPQWFNTGLHWAYGIAGPASGQWTVQYGKQSNLRRGAPSIARVAEYIGDTEDYLYETDNSYERPQPHACFIQPVADDLVNDGGIMDLWRREVRLFKHGSGTGTNFSTIRGKGEKLSGGGVSSGLMSFLRIGDQAAGSIASGGVTRRAAKMVVLDLDHPEVEEFINWKVEEEYKAAAMATGSRLIRQAREHGSDNWYLIPRALWDRVENGFEPVELGEGWEGAAISSVSGQNSNNSLRIPNAFMEALDSGEAATWNLRARTTGDIVKRIPVKDLWDEICRAAWACADPGVQFDDVINDWHTCSADGRIRSSNPCSEYMFLDDTACNLASLNLCAFRNDDGSYDYAAYEYATHVWTIVLEISVQMASFPSREIALGSYNYRTLGLGYANLGGLLMRDAIPYDSNKACALAAGLTALMTGVAYRTSAQMATELGPFPRWEQNADAMWRVIRNHAACAAGNLQYEGLSIPPIPLDHSRLPIELSHRIGMVWSEVCNAQSFRNAQVTLLAPTGTISFVMDCDTTGVEPDFELMKVKQLAGGGTMLIMNTAIDTVLATLGFSGQRANDIREYILEHRSLRNWPGMTEPEWRLKQVLADANMIDPLAHIRMVAAVQPFLSGAVSKTTNMPHNATPDDVALVYKTAHQLGVKAVALYRDGSKLTQPLKGQVEDRKPPGRVVPLPLPQVAAGPPSREMLPWRREHGFTQKVKIDGQSVYLHVGEYDDGRPGEIFLELAHQGSTLRAMGNLFAIAVSIGLQHGVPIQQYIKNFLHTKFEPAGIVEGHDQIKMVSSIADYVARELAITYLHRDDLANVVPESTELRHPDREYQGDRATTAIGFDLTRTGGICPQCHNATLVTTGTCTTCRNCAYNTGCG